MGNNLSCIHYHDGKIKSTANLDSSPQVSAASYLPKRLIVPPRAICFSALYAALSISSSVITGFVDIILQKNGVWLAKGA